MAKLSVKAGATSQSVNIFIQDSTKTDGSGLSGLLFNTASLVASYSFAGANATRTAITLATLAVVNSAFSSGGFKELDATNMKGGYRFDIPDAALAAASGQSVTFELHGAANMVPCWFEIELTGWNNQSTTDGGLSKLTSLTFTGANKVDASVRDWIGGTIPAVNVTGVPLIDLKYTLGTISPAQAGSVAADWAATTNKTSAAVLSATTIATTQKVDVDTIKTNPVVNGGTLTFPTNATLASTTNITAGTITTATNLTNAPTSGDFTATMKTSIGTAVAASAVASVTGAVGSVTGLTASDVGAIKTKTDFLPSVTAGAAGGVFIAGTNAATTITTGLTTHFIGTIDTLTTYSGNTPQTGDNYARLGAPAGASHAADTAAVKVDTAAILGQTGTTGVVLTAAERNAVADAHLDRTDGIEVGLTPRQAHKVEAAGAAGKISGAETTTTVIRNAKADSKNRITATVDSNGNRSAVTLDLT